MTTPRIEEIVEEFRNKILDVETAIRLTYNEKESDEMVLKMTNFLRTALSQAHQAGIDEAVEIVQSLRVKEVHDEPCDGYCETWSCPWPNSRERNRTLDATIKALQNKK